MIAAGSLVSVKKPFLRKSSSSQGSYDNSSTTVSDHKTEQGKTSDLFDTAIRLTQLELVKETNQKVQSILTQNSTIIATLAEVMNEIHKLKGSRNNNFVSEFA